MRGDGGGHRDVRMIRLRQKLSWLAEAKDEQGCRDDGSWSWRRRVSVTPDFVPQAGTGRGIARQPRGPDRHKDRGSQGSCWSAFEVGSLLPAPRLPRWDDHPGVWPDADFPPSRVKTACWHNPDDDPRRQFLLRAGTGCRTTELTVEGTPMLMTMVEPPSARLPGRGRTRGGRCASQRSPRRRRPAPGFAVEVVLLHRRLLPKTSSSELGAEVAVRDLTGLFDWCTRASRQLTGTTTALGDSGVVRRDRPADLMRRRRRRQVVAVLHFALVRAGRGWSNCSSSRLRAGGGPKDGGPAVDGRLGWLAFSFVREVGVLMARAAGSVSGEGWRLVPGTAIHLTLQVPDNARSAR